MKKNIFSLVVMLLFASVTFASSLTMGDSNLFSGSWSTNSTPALKVDQKFYDNWSSAGNSQLALTATYFGNYKYTHSKFIWDNVADLAFGYNWQDLVKDSLRGFAAYDSRRKSDDKIDLTSTFSMRMKNAWNVNATANFKTQFGSGYNYPTTDDNDREKVSRFMAPAYLTTAIGFEHKEDNWNVVLSFLTGKTTFVYDDSLIAAGYDYGVVQKDPDYKTNGNFTHAYFGLGSYIKFFYKKDIAKNLNLYTRLELFYDYRKPGLLNWDNLVDPSANPDASDYDIFCYNERLDKSWLGRRAYETDLDWELTLDYRFSSFLSAYFSLNMKYDTDFMGYQGRLDRWQIYQSAGLQIYFNWKTPKE